MAVYLVPVTPGHTIVLDKAVVFVGRHPDCDVVLTQSRKVSRKHCCICQVNDSFVVRDLGSMNGIRVNGNRVKKESRLGFGDELAIGDVCYTLQRHKASAPPRNPPAAAGRRAERARPGESARKPRASESRQAVPARPARPLELSQDFPIPVADDGESFAVYGRVPDAGNLETVGQVDDDVPEAIIIDDDSQSEIAELDED